VSVFILLAKPLKQENRFSMTDAAIDRAATPAKLKRVPLQWQTMSDATIEDGILAKRYLIQSQLGRGGFGITFLARNIYLPGQPLCAIKKLAPKFTDPQLIKTASRQFELEALSLSRLGSHAQVPALLDYFQIGNDLYLVEEYIPGIVLTQIIRKQRKFTEAEIEKFLNQMLRLLEYIHSHHLIHRDIKPQNIILCQTDRRFVLVDFGAVKDLDPNTLPKQSTIESSAVGTPGFAPPEQLANRAVYASDLYALGMTCVYLLTGKEPSQFPINPHTCELIWTDTVELSADLSEIISKMIQIPLSDRYQSAERVLTALGNRAIRAKLRSYLDQKHAISNSEQIGSASYYPAVVHWALGMEQANNSPAI
jgi:serine/threonine protein kinase